MVDRDAGAAAWRLAGELLARRGRPLAGSQRAFVAPRSRLGEDGNLAAPLLAAAFAAQGRPGDALSVEPSGIGAARITVTFARQAAGS